MRKALAIFVVAAALLVVLYAAAGYWIAPRLLHQELAERAARAGVELQVRHVRTNPFLLTLALEGVRASGGAGAAAAERITADLAWSSLWRRTWIVERLSIHAAQLRAAPGEAGTPFAPDVPILIRELAVENAALQLPGFALQDVSIRASGLSTLKGARASFRAGGSAAAGGTFTTEGTASLAPLRAEGELAFSALPLAALWPGNPLGEASLAGRSRYLYADADLRAHDVSVEATGVAYAGIELPQVSLQASSVDLPPRQPFEATVRASVAPRGEIVARGTIDPQPGSVDLEIEGNALPLALAQRWIPQGVAVQVAAGVLSADGRLRASRGQGASYAGSAAVSDLQLEEAGSGVLLLAWQHAEAAQLELSGDALRIPRLEVRQPEAQLVIGRDGTLNAVAVLQPGEGDGDGAFRLAIAELHVTGGTLHFADRSLDDPFETVIRELSGSISGFRTGNGEPARVLLAGRVAPAGTARIEGRIDLESPSDATDVRAELRGLRLQSFNPYVVRFAGHRIESGSISADLRYEVRNGRLQGTNRLAFEQMQLGEKVESAGAPDLPLDLLVALLADPGGHIDLRIPVSGNLRDPKFDFGAIVRQAIGNALRRIVSAPFRALASLFGGEAGRELGEVRFEPGTVQFTPQARRNLRDLAQALAQRPGLEVAVHGGYDAERDAAALRAITARRQIAARAGVDRPLDLEDREVLVAAERLFLERAGNRLELQALRAKEKPYGRALLDKLAAQVPVGEGGMNRVARGRAEVVRAALIELGVDPSRVRVEGARRADASGHGVPVTLTLSAAGRR